MTGQNPCLSRSLTLQYLQKMQRAIHPGRNPQQDDILPPITSVTEVRVSGDLSVAKVYVSVYGDDEEQAATLEKLYRLQG